MDVCFFSSGFPPSKGGVATYSYEWVMNTAAYPLTSSVRVVAFGNPQPRVERKGKVCVEAYRTRNAFLTGLFIFIAFVRLRRWHFFHATNLFPVGFWAVFFGRLFRKSVILNFYGTDACARQASMMVRLMKRWTIEHATRCIPVSNATWEKAKFFLKVRTNNAVMIYPGVPIHILFQEQQQYDVSREIEKWRRDLQISEETFGILCVNQLVRRKGVDDVMSAVASLDDPSVALFIIGKGPEQSRIDALRDTLTTRSRIYQLGKIEHLLPFFHLGKVLVLASYEVAEEGDYEGLGLVLLEAQAHGLPVIGTRSGGIPEAIDEGRSGFLVPERDPREIAGKLKLLKDHQDQYEIMSKAARAFVSEKFNPKKNIGEYMRMLQGLGSPSHDHESY